MTSPMLPSLLTTERTCSELQGLMTASESWADDYAGFDGGDIFSQSFYGVHDYLREGDDLYGYTTNGIMQSQLDTAYPTTFNSASGSSHSENVYATHSQSGVQTTQAQVYSSQPHQNVMSMGMDSFAHLYLDPAMLFDQPGAGIYAGAATGTEATGSFSTQSTYPQAGNIDAFSYASSVDAPAVEGVLALSPTSSQDFLATQFSLAGYPVAEADALYDGDQLDDILHPFRRAQLSAKPDLAENNRHSGGLDFSPDYYAVEAPMFNLAADMSPSSSSSTLYSDNALEQDGPHVSTPNEKLNDTTNISYSTERATQDIDLSVGTSISNGKKRAIGELEDEARQENTISPRKRSSRGRESSGVTDASAIQSDYPDLSVNTASPTASFPTPEHSYTDKEPSPAAPGTIAVPDALPTLAQTPEPAVAVQLQAGTTTPLRCHICVANGASSNTYARRAELNRHIKQKHISRGVTCQLCGDTLSNEYAVRRHIKTKACKSFKQ